MRILPPLLAMLLAFPLSAHAAQTDLLDDMLAGRPASITGSRAIRQEARLCTIPVACNDDARKSALRCEMLGPLDRSGCRNRVADSLRLCRAAGNC